jgi:hypothetical protein
VGHAVLLGDSIFDNARYVPGHPPVIDQLRRGLPGGWKATHAAVDGHTAGDVPGQLARVPADATHLFVSAGGNDALGASEILEKAADSVGHALAQLHAAQAEFRRIYRGMLRVVLALGKPTAVCTVYDAVPGLGPAELTALGLFNEVILREAFLAGLPVVDLRLVCTHAGDYSPLSPIEPSTAGGSKITRVVAEVATSHDFSRRHSVVYS